MSERNDAVPNIGSVTVFGADVDSALLYVRITAPFRHGKVRLRPALRTQAKGGVRVVG
jgi:hypothetical protein